MHGVLCVLQPVDIIVVTMAMTWLPWGCLTCWVAGPVSRDAEEGVDDGRPAPEEDGDHIQPLWAQQLEQLEGEGGRERGGQNQSTKIQSSTVAATTSPPTHTHTHAHASKHGHTSYGFLLPRMSTW